MYFERIRRGARLACAFAVLSLAACGGGGGGGGTDLSTAPGITVSPTALSFVAVQNRATPVAQNVQITLSRPDAVFVGLAFPAGNVPGWLDLSQARLTRSSWTAAIVTTSLPPGTYTTTASIGIADAKGDILAYRNVQISYTIELIGLVANPQGLNFSQLQGAGTPVAQTVGVSDTSGASYPWSASIVYQSGSGWLNIDGAASASGTTLPSSLSLSVNPTSSIGTLSALVRVTGNGHRLDFPVTYSIIEPTLSPSATHLTFTATTQSTLPASQDVVLSTQGGLPVNYTTSINNYDPSANGWLTVPASGTAPGTVSIGINTTNLSLGTHTATINFSTATQSVAVTVTYDVTRPFITFSPASASFAIDATSLPAALNQSIAVGSSGVPLTWTSAVSSQPWVTVSPPTGTTTSSIGLNLIPAQFETLDPGQYSATITLSYTPPGGIPTTASLPVSLNLQIPKVASVHPYVATSGTSLEVILRGSGFANPGGATVTFSNSAPVIGTAVSDTELRVTHPSLTAGTYLVTVPNQLGILGDLRSTAKLVVVDAPVYAATAIAYPSSGPWPVKRVIYDAERKALIVATQGVILRYAFDGSAWSVSPTLVAVSARDAAPTLDGKRLLVTDENSIKEFDMATLAAGASTSVSLFIQSLPEFLNRLAVANDGNALVTTGIFGSGNTETYKYSIADRTFTMNPVNDLLSRADAGGSADGSLLLLPQNGVSPPPAVYKYNASTSALSPTNLSLTASFPVLDRRATRILLGGFSIYDGNLQFQGLIGGNSLDSQTLSPDGRRAYAPDRISGGAIVPTVLRTYDLTAAPVAGKFPELVPAMTLPCDPGHSVMTVSPDGGTLFIAGSDCIVVVPAP